MSLFQSQQPTVNNKQKGYVYDTPTNQLDLTIQNQNPSNKENDISKNFETHDQQNLPNPFLYGPQSQNTKQQQQQASACQILFPQFQVKSINFVVVILLTLYFIAQYLYYHIGPQNLYGCALYDLGAKFTPAIYHKGHFHRLVISIFLFGSLLQAIICLFTLLMFGFILENSYKWTRYLLVLILSGFQCNLMSALIHPFYVSVGSSGMIFGMLMLHLTLLAKNYKELGPPKNLIISLFVIIVIANFIALIDTKAIDIGGIFGGCLAGGFLGIFFYDSPNISNGFKIFQKISLAFFCLIMLGTLISVFTVSVEYIDIEKWCL